jgi:group II intron reverse transcriptase/maturase
MTSKDEQVELMPSITSRENLLLALRNVRNNKGAMTAGTDGKTVKDYLSMETEEYLKAMQEALKGYSPLPVRRAEIPKPNGKKRPLGIPTMRDRLIQQATLQVLEPICEAKFSNDSYGFRPGRSTENAIAALNRHINLGHMYHVVDMDIMGFFDNVSHFKLLRQLWTIGIKDGDVIELISRMLKAEIVHPDGRVEKPKKGTPQGRILSPLLANVALNDLDHWINSKWKGKRTRLEYKCKKQSRRREPQVQSTEEIHEAKRVAHRKVRRRRENHLRDQDGGKEGIRSGNELPKEISKAGNQPGEIRGSECQETPNGVLRTIHKGRKEGQEVDSTVAYAGEGDNQSVRRHQGAS